MVTSRYKTSNGAYLAWCERPGCGWRIDGLDAAGAEYEQECHELYHVGREIFRFSLMLGHPTVRWSRGVAARRPRDNRFGLN